MPTKALFNFLIFFSLNLSSLFGAAIDTFYGTIDVEEPVLLELIDSPPFQRLKFIHQYGVSYYTTDREEYTRYAHSLGVFALLRLNGASLKEQIAGLLHDVSHTAFSHVGDWIFDKAGQNKDYQNSIHPFFLKKYGLGDILNKYGISVDEVLPLEHLFPMLEQPGPNMCADRIEYNIQGAYLRGFITYEEAMAMAAGLTFLDGRWVSDNPLLMAKLGRYSLYMTQVCWGSATNHMSSTWLARAILKAVELGLISHEDIHFGVDDEIWEILATSTDPIIREQMEKIASATSYYCLVDPADPETADIVVKSKFRGIDPWILSDGEIRRLTAVDPLYNEEYLQVKEKMAQGWHIKYLLSK